MSDDFERLVYDLRDDAKTEGALYEHACIVAFLCDLKSDHRKAGRTVEMQAIADAVNAIAAGSHRG